MLVCKPIFRLTFILSTALLAGCGSSGSIKIEKKLIQQQVVDNPAIVEGRLESESSTLRYFHNGKPNKPAIVFLHGSPSSWKSMSRFMVETDLLASFQMYAIDRPGWGESVWQPNKEEDFFFQQSREIARLLESVKNSNQGKPIFLVGHSLGSSLAPAIAFYYPELVDGLVLISGSLDPELGKPRWYNYAAKVWPISSMLRKRSLQANHEIWQIKPGLEAIDDFWAKPNMPIVVIQGGRDKQVHPANAEFVRQRVSKTWLTLHWLPEQSHFAHIEQRELVVSSVLKLLHQMQP